MDNVQSPILTFWGMVVEKSKQCGVVVQQFVGDYCTESRTEINKQHPHICVLLFQVHEGCLLCTKDLHCSVCKLVLVKIRVMMVLMCIMISLSKHFMITGVRATGQ